MTTNDRWCGVLELCACAGCFVLGTSLGLLYAFYVPSPYPDSGFLLHELPASGAFTLVNKFTNAFLVWRLNPMWVPFWNDFGQEFVTAVMLGIFAAGTVSAAQRIRAVEHRPALVWVAACALIAAALVPMLFGLDTVLISALCWFPFYLSALSRLQRGDRGALVLAMAAALLLALDAGQLALPLALFGCLLLWPLGQKHRGWLWAPLLIPIFRAGFVDWPVFPDYPPFSHVVPGYDTAEGLYSLLGPEAPLPLIDRSYVRWVALYSGVALSVLTLLAAIFEARRSVRRPHARTLLWGAGVLAVCMLLDCSLFAPTYSQIAPLASLSRIFPGLSLVPLAPIAAIAGFLLVMLWNAGTPPVRWAGVWGFLALAGALSVAALNLTNMPLLAARDRADILRRGGLAPDPILLSPSLYIGSRHSERVLSLNRGYDFRPLSEFNAQVAVSHNPALAASLMDNNVQTTWYPYGGQFGAEWIQIEFPEVQRVDGVKLDPGAFRTDFPRGLKLSGGQDCANLALLSQSADWQGELLFTPHGFPYYAEQSRVTIKLDQSSPVRCLRIEQIGQSPHFNWNVAEVSISAQKN